MKCPSCSAEIGDNSKFCPECGEKIVRKTVCPDCGTEAAPGAKFCAECGHRFAAAAPRPAAPRPAAPAPAPAPKPAAPDPAALKAAVDRVFALFHDKDGNCKNATREDARLVKAAAEGGNARAMFLLGEILADGCEGFAKDPKASAEWYRKSAEAGEAWGMTAYGTVLANGDPDIGLEKNADAAREWIAKGGALFIAQGEQTAMNAAMLMFAVAQAPKPDGEDGPPDLGVAASMASALLKAAGDVDPETSPAVDRLSVGGAHFILAMDAMSKQDFDLAREHLEQGADFGNEDCKKSLEEIDGGGGAEDSGDDTEDDEEGDDTEDGEDGDDTEDGDEDAGDDTEDDEEAGGIVVSNCGFETEDGETFTLNLDLRNDGESDSGPLRVSLWYSKDGYDEADGIDGYVMADAEVSVQSLRQGQSLENLIFRNRQRIGDPETGDYVATFMVEELVDGGDPEDNGDWLTVDYVNFDGTFHWNHVGDDDEAGDGDVSDEGDASDDGGGASDDDGGASDDEDDDGGVIEIGGHLARAGDSTLLDMKGCIYALAEAPADLEFAYVPTNVAVRIKRIENPTSQASGSIKVIFWVCKAEQDPDGDLDGEEAWEQIVSEESLGPGEAIEDISLSGEVMAAGRTWFVATVNELNGDGTWYIVDRKDFPPIDFPTTVVE